MSNLLQRGGRRIERRDSEEIHQRPPLDETERDVR